MFRNQSQQDRDWSDTEWSDQESQGGADERLATGLGWFSIGLGLAEVVSPGKVAELIGVRDEERTRNLLRAYGVRELMAGFGILTQPRPAGWMWSRVAGDMLDLATLGTAMASSATDKSRLATATAAVVGVTALDILCAQQLTDRQSYGKPASSMLDVRVVRMTRINRSPDEVYAFWRDFENLPRFMTYLESVSTAGDRRSHWRAKGPGGTTYEWDAEMTEDQPGRRIAWRSLENSDIWNTGSVEFQPAPGGRGTFVRVDIEYAPPGGPIGATIAKLFGREPGQLVDDDLRRFKQVMETGEVVHSDASIHTSMHPAQPPGREVAELANR